MGRHTLGGVVAALAMLAVAHGITCTGPQSNFYNTVALGQDGRNHSLAQYAGNVTLVVNVASF